MAASEWPGLRKLLVITWQMVGSLPPRFQLVTMPSVWLRLKPLSKVELSQKLLGRKTARAARLLPIINSAVRQKIRTRTFISGFDFFLVVCGPATGLDGCHGILLKAYSVRPRWHRKTLAHSPWVWVPSPESKPG